MIHTSNPDEQEQLIGLRKPLKIAYSFHLKLNWKTEMHLRVAPLDMVATKPRLQAPVQLYADSIDLRMAADDGMKTRDDHYLLVGASALAAIMSALNLSGGRNPGSILDFGSGAGRVTRWLKAAYPDASLACCDLRPQDVEFCNEVFRAEAWLSSTDIEACDFRGPYDLIWMGSYQSSRTWTRRGQAG